MARDCTKFLQATTAGYFRYPWQHLTEVGDYFDVECGDSYAQALQVSRRISSSAQYHKLPHTYDQQRTTPKTIRTTRTS